MSTCLVCGKSHECPDSNDALHTRPVGGAVQDCPLRKGSIWVQVLDDKGAGVLKAAVTIAGKPAETDDSGFAYSDPLDEATYEIVLGEALPDTHKDTHLPPDARKPKTGVKPGEITLVKFRLERINLVTPKIEEEYKVVILDRGLAAHQAGEPDAGKLHPEATRVELSVTETNREQYPFKTTGKLKCVPENVEVFLDQDCKTPFTDDVKAESISGGKKLHLWLRGKSAGKFDAFLELADTGDPRIRAIKESPKIGMGVVELVLEVHQHDVAAVRAIPVDPPDTDPISDYHTHLNNTDLPDQKVMTDADKVKIGRLLHEQKDSNHGRAKLVVKKLVAAQWPAGTDDYEIYLNRTNTSGALELFDAQWDGAQAPLPAGPFKVSELKANEKTLWVQGSTACAKWRDVRLDLSLDRAEGGLAKDVKRNADWARFTVVSLNEIKLDYTPEALKANAWDSVEKRFFINLKADPDGRKITIGAQLSTQIKDVVLHFMLIEHKDNRKAANWGVDLPDGTRALNPTAVVDDAGTAQVFAANEPKWVWKDLSADIKHLDKDDRKNLLHYSEKTDAKGYAKKEVKLSRFGGDKFYLAAYVEQDPHLAKYIDGHADLSKRKPVMTADPLQVWRKFWYKEVKVAGLLVSGFRDAADTYKDVKALMVPGTVVEMPRTTADAINPPVIYKKHMVSYYSDATGYHNNFPGDTGDALVVGDATESDFFALAAAEGDKPVMYPMLNAHALWVAGGADPSAPVSTGPATYPWATPAEFNSNSVKMTLSYQLLDPPLQGGTLLVRGKWAAQDWVPHPNAATPSGPEQPAGAAPGRWGNGRQGDLQAGDVSLDPNRSNPHDVRVTLPAGVVVGAFTRIKIFGLHVQCASNFLGTSYPDGIVNAFTPNDLQDFVNTINHETGHSFQQVVAGQPGNVPKHPLQYQNQGSHCAFDNSSCVMFESGPQLTSLNRYCPVCQPYMLVSDMSDVNGKL